MGRTTLGLQALLVVLSCSAAWLGCSKFSEAEDATDDAGTSPQEEAGVGLDSSVPDAEAAAPLFLDTFTRTESAGWGLPDVGERWRVLGTASVENGVGQLKPLIGQGVYAFSNPIPVRDLDIEAAFTPSAISGPDGGLGGGLFFALVARSSPDNSTNYGASAIVQQGGVVGFALTVRVATVEKRLARLTANPTVRAGEALRLRLQVSGASPTLVRGKVWLASDPEPAAWTGEGKDDTPTLQQGGRLGVTAYLSDSAAVAPTGTVDDVTARALP